VQQWINDRDLLVEETSAFTQRVAAANPVRIETSTQVERPKRVELVQLAIPRDRLATQIDRYFERYEIRRHVADFKATQNMFQREREEYYEATITKVHSNSSRGEA
jgi:hypothetical protein